MSHPSLLAVGLIAPGQFLDATVDLLSPPSPEQFADSVQFDDFSAELSPTQLLAAFPDVETWLQPEFSDPKSQAVTAFSYREAIAPVPPSTTWENRQILPDEPMFRPTSGSQMYHQRWAALKAGKTYTRLAPDSFVSEWLLKSASPKSVQPPTHAQWKQLLALEAKAIASGQGTNPLNILIGDSLSLWFPSESLPSGKLWLNQAVSGETTRHIRQRLALLAPTRPDKIYLMAGINDLRHGASDSEILANTRLILEQLRAQFPQTQIIVQSILPTRLAAIPNSRIQALNQQIAEIALPYNVQYLDIHAQFLDDQGRLRYNLTTDGIHLSRQGYQVWQQALQSVEDNLQIASIR